MLKNLAPTIAEYVARQLFTPFMGTITTHELHRVATSDDYDGPSELDVSFFEVEGSLDVYTVYAAANEDEAVRLVIYMARHMAATRRDVNAATYRNYTLSLYPLGNYKKDASPFKVDRTMAEVNGMTFPIDYYFNIYTAAPGVPTP